MSSESLFEKNLAALTDDSSTGELAELLRSTSPPENIEIVATPSGNPTCRADGVWVYSRHDPAREARRLVERELPATTEVCVFENLGLGYHVEAYLLHSPEGRAVVVEPDLRWLRLALEARDLTLLLTSERVQFLIDAHAGMLQTVLGETYDVRLLRLRSLANKDHEYFEALGEEVRAHSTRKDINANTLARFGRRWVRNLIHNIRILPEAHGVNELQEAFAGIPALLLAAGPSLDELMPRLAALRERFLIIAVDTSYRAALAAGVTPDFLVVVDPQYWNARHLDGCSLESTILVSESSTYPGVFHREVGSLYFCGSLFPLGQYLERVTGEKGKLGAGGSVSTTTWDFARTLGCSPIVCAGLDLGFPELRTHFHGGFFEERMHTLSDRTRTAASMAFHLLRDASPYPVANNDGGSTLTDRRLIIYKWWFEDQLRMHPMARTLNLSRFGIKIDGMAHTSLPDLEEYPVIRKEIDRRMRLLEQESKAGRLQAKRKEQLKLALSELSEELGRLAEMAGTGLVALDSLERVLAENRDPTTGLSELEAVDDAISRLMNRDVAGFLMHSTARTILERDHSDGAQREQPLRDSRDLYTKLKEAAEYHVDLLRNGEKWF